MAAWQSLSRRARRGEKWWVRVHSKGNHHEESNAVWAPRPARAARGGGSSKGSVPAAAARSAAAWLKGTPGLGWPCGHPTACRAARAPAWPCGRAAPSARYARPPRKRGAKGPPSRPKGATRPPRRCGRLARPGTPRRRGRRPRACLWSRREAAQEVLTSASSPLGVKGHRGRPPPVTTELPTGTHPQAARQAPRPRPREPHRQRAARRHSSKGRRRQPRAPRRSRCPQSPGASLPRRARRHGAFAAARQGRGCRRPAACGATQPCHPHVPASRRLRRATVRLGRAPPRCAAGPRRRKETASCEERGARERVAAR
jgi:hypothetical protein